MISEITDGDNQRDIACSWVSELLNFQFPLASFEIQKRAPISQKT